MTECNAIIKANNEIDKLKRENKKLNALCVQYGFDMGRLEEENEELKLRFKEERDTAMKLGSECDSLIIKNQKLELEIIRLEMIIKTGEKMTEI